MFLAGLRHPSLVVSAAPLGFEICGSPPPLHRETKKLELAFVPPLLRCGFGLGAQHAALLAFLHSLALDFYSFDSAPSWRNHRLDHVVCNVNCQRFADQPECSWASVQVRADVQQALGGDHCLLRSPPRPKLVMDSCALGPSPDPHCFLSSCASACCSRAPALRFQDSVALKELCQARSLTSDTGLRRRLSLDIYRLRALERRQWKAALLDGCQR